MAITLKSIRFNHDINESRTSAFNIRKNKEVEILVPEFDVDRPRPIDFSAAAYSITETSGQRVVVRVGFAITPDETANYEIQALDGGVLGVLSGRVSFTAGQSGESQIEMVLNNRDFTKIGRFDISWNWQYRRNANEAWQTLTTTRHRIYLSFGIPDLPFVQTPFDRRNPWTELLDHSCVIAQGLRNQEEASEALTKALYQNYRLLYLSWPTYSTASSASDFNLSNWIRCVLNGDTSGSMPNYCTNPVYIRPFCLHVNCYDMAGSLALMSKAIGINTNYYLHEPFGYYNPLYPIGRELTNSSSVCEASVVFGLDEINQTVPGRPYRGRFGNHAYTKLRDTKIYDACMREGVNPMTAIMLYIATIILFIITFGALYRRDWINRAGGWLVDMDQSDYERKIIDRSTEIERALSRGVPVRQEIGFLTS